MQEEYRGTLLRSVKARLSEARHILGFIALESEEADLINVLIDITDLAVTDCMQGITQAG